jgi:beta-lactamase regulating signal transducer with metallopeptidase domain
MSFDFLTEMAWKSALIGGAALLMAAVLMRRSAGERSAVLRTGVAAILLLPVISWLLPALPVVTHTIYESGEPVALAAAAIPGALPATPTPASWDDPTPLIELAWLGGVVMVLLRLGVGLATLSRWTRGGSKVACPEWRAAFARALAASDCRRPVRLLVTDAPSPMSWGWIRPVILLDRDTVRDSDEADAVLAHELAHVVRRDWLTLVLARIMVAIFWFNPLLWLLERRLVVEAEEAADARALEHVEPGRYAQTLLSCAQQFSALTVPAAGIADAGLARRVRAILDRKLRAGAPDPRRVRAAICLCALVAAPIAALKPVEAVVRVGQPPAAPPAPAAPDARAMPSPPEAPSTPAAPAAPQAPVAVSGYVETSALPPAPTAPLAPSAPILPTAAVAPVPPAPPASPTPPSARAPRASQFWTDEDSREIANAVREAMNEAGRARGEALADAARARDEAMRDAARYRADAMREAGRARSDALRETLRAREDARRAIEIARVERRRGMADGAEGMESGARGMEQGARHMDSEADRLRSESYRNEQIARAARQGRKLSHQELLAMIPRLHAGAEKLRRGAERMRGSARKMRDDGKQ